jgi:hypothetical protein
MVTPRGPENVTGSPASAASWQIPSTSALGEHLLLLVAIFDEFRTKPQPRQRRPKIVGHRRYHARAIVVETAQPRLHPVERVDGSS